MPVSESDLLDLIGNEAIIEYVKESPSIIDAIRDEDDRHTPSVRIFDDDDDPPEVAISDEDANELADLYRSGNKDALLERLRVLLMDATGRIL